MCHSFCKKLELGSKLKPVRLNYFIKKARARPSSKLKARKKLKPEKFRPVPALYNCITLRHFDPNKIPKMFPSCALSRKILRKTSLNAAVTFENPFLKICLILDAKNIWAKSKFRHSFDSKLETVFFKQTSLI